MPEPNPDLVRHVLSRLREVQKGLGIELTSEDVDVRLADAVDSMGLVELITVLAAECGVRPRQIEEAVQHRFGTVTDLARALAAAGLWPRMQGGSEAPVATRTCVTLHPEAEDCWLAAPIVRLPDQVEASARLDERLGRPVGWLEEHAGIRQRRVWGTQEPLAAAATAGRACLEEAGLSADELGALLVTSEAPPLLAGLAAALHHRLGLRSTTPALEVGGACTGFLAAVWLGRSLVPRAGPVLLLAIEAPTRYLRIEPGPAGEAAALFGDGAAACLVGGPSLIVPRIPLLDVRLTVDGAAGPLLQVEGPSEARIRMDGTRLAGLAVETMAQSIEDVTRDHGFGVQQLTGVVVHAGNGRIAGLVARRLALPAERVWSRTAETGNLGSASLPVAWEGRKDSLAGPVAWACVCAGLLAGCALTGPAASADCVL